MNNLFSKLKDFVSFNEPGDFDDDYDEVDNQNYPAHYNQETTSVPAVSEEARRRMRERSLSTPPVGMTPSEPVRTATMNNVIGMPGSGNGVSEVVVMEPRSFEEMPQAILALRERKSVVLNLTLMDPDQAQRAVDFIAGGTYALDGHQERIGESIFLFTPNCVQVSSPSGAMRDMPQPQMRSARPPGRAVGAPWTVEQGQL